MRSSLSCPHRPPRSPPPPHHYHARRQEPTLPDGQISEAKRLGDKAVVIRLGSGEVTVEVAARAVADRHGRAWKTGMSVSTAGDNALYAPLGERLAPLGAVAVAVLSQVLMHDRIVLGPLLLVPIIEVSLGVVLARAVNILT